MKICILQPSYLGSTSAIANLDPPRDLTQWLDGHESLHLFLDKATAARALKHTVATFNPDVFINLCDGSADEDDTPGIDIVDILQKLNKPFTGADAWFYDPRKEVMKKVCQYWGINTPTYAFAFNDADIESAITKVRMPSFVKCYNGGNSIGIGPRSRVNTADELREQARIMIQKYGGALIEEFIDGREFSVFIVSNPDNEKEPIVYPPVECIFPPGLNFKTFDFKWKPFQGQTNPWIPCGSHVPAEKISEMQQMTTSLFIALGGNGYARSDIRMDSEGRLFLLEINPNCSVFYPDDNNATADQILLFAEGADGKRHFLDTIVRHALTRHQKHNNRTYVVRIVDGGPGFGMFAARDIAPGELIYRLEEQPHTLVSYDWVQQHWSPIYKSFFRDFCYPITDDLYVMWDIHPDNWKPINHSCDPNAWVTGLDLFARNHIKAGEQITMDYSTMYCSDHMTFTCMCGSPLCRGSWRGTDFLQPWHEQRYGTHVTDYVKQKRAQHQLIQKIQAQHLLELEQLRQCISQLHEQHRSIASHSMIFSPAPEFCKTAAGTNRSMTPNSIPGDP